ncbi:MAG: HAD hydrolase-like protein [Thermodesulfobacteriota bacterium]
MFKGFIFDLEGTVYLNDQLILGADRVIQLIREKGRKVVFLSHNPFETQKDCAERLIRLGIPTLPEEVIYSTHTIQTVLREMGLMPEDCILIGDCLETDIRIGKEVGMATGIVFTGVTDEETLKKIKHSPDQPDFVFQSIAEVENLLIG